MLLSSADLVWIVDSSLATSATVMNLVRLDCRASPVTDSQARSGMAIRGLRFALLATILVDGAASAAKYPGVRRAMIEILQIYGSGNLHSAVASSLDAFQLT